MAAAAARERVACGQRYRFTVDEFAPMGEAGIFAEHILGADAGPREGR